jgi:5-methyltetrahydropteroyltriglutamate--homocysteine methyltransferase
VLHTHDLEEETVKATVLGSYPKIPQGAGASVRSALRRFEAGEWGPRQLEETYREVTRRTLRLFEEAGLTTVTDGQIPWEDLLDPVVRDVDNLVAGGLERFFDNNFYYRRPTVVGRLRWRGGVLAHWTRLAKEQTTLPFKVALPGPITLVALSADATYGDPRRLLQDAVEVLALEAESVVAQGAQEVQWDEPAAVYGACPFPAPQVEEAWRELLSVPLGVPQSLAFYYGSAARWLPSLASLPVARVYVDLVADPSLAAALAQRPYPFEVGLGLVDARDVRLEEKPRVEAVVQRVASVQGRDRLWLCPTGGLELLPPDRAEEKVRHLGRLARELSP